MIADHTLDATMTDIARRILRNAPPRFMLVGLSMGGYIALEIMRQAAQRVVKLALLDTSARNDTPEQGDRRRRFISMAENGRLEQIAEQLFPILVHSLRRNHQSLYQIIRLMAVETGPDAFIRQQKAIISRPDSRPGLGAIQCPTLVVVGDEDQITPPELAQEMAAGIRGARLVTVPQCGHMSTLEQPHTVTQALVDWLQ